MTIRTITPIRDEFQKIEADRMVAEDRINRRQDLALERSWLFEKWRRPIDRALLFVAIGSIFLSGFFEIAFGWEQHWLYSVAQVVIGVGWLVSMAKGPIERMLIHKRAAKERIRVREQARERERIASELAIREAERQRLTEKGV